MKNCFSLFFTEYMDDKALQEEENRIRNDGSLEIDQEVLGKRKYDDMSVGGDGDGNGNGKGSASKKITKNVDGSVGRLRIKKGRKKLMTLED